jgi:protoporphyrinogen oxidase
VIFSEDVDGFTIDGGPDALLIQKPEAIALCREIGLGDRLVSTKPPRIAYIQRGGRLHALPAASVLGIPTRVGPFVGTTLFSWAGKLRMGAELFVPPRRDDADESIGAFMTRRFGVEATTYLAEPLLAGIHAGDVDRLSVRALFPRLVDAERTHGSLLRSFRKSHLQSAARNSNRRAFKSLPGGLSEMVRAGRTRSASTSDRRRRAITGRGPFIVRSTISTPPGRCRWPSGVRSAARCCATATRCWWSSSGRYSTRRPRPWPCASSATSSRIP